MKLTLKFRDEKNSTKDETVFIEKTFMTDFISARCYRQALELDKRLDFNNLSPEETDELVGFVRNVFNKEFTIDEFWDGIPANKLLETIQGAFDAVSGRESKSAQVSEGNGKK